VRFYHTLPQTGLSQQLFTSFAAGKVLIHAPFRQQSFIICRKIHIFAVAFTTRTIILTA
jgi:hypothetical protein